MKYLQIVSLIVIFVVNNTFGRTISASGTNLGDLVVNTTTGLLRGGVGHTTVGKNKPVYWFRSIPYAEPPVGNLRFQPPVPKKTWSGILNVSKDSPECIQSQSSVTDREDCLYLKIYTTRLLRELKEKFPVFVVIHGGAFISGSPNLTFDKPDFFLDENVIVAAPQYRLGLFGFLSTGDLVAPGNNGLRDLILALKWIKENIEAFGGDPDNITIQGQSAGSALVSYLLQAPQAKGLYHRAIMQSGTSLSLWSLFRQGPQFAINVANKLNIDTYSSHTLVDGLKSVEAKALLEAQSSVLINMFTYSNARDGLLLGPVMEPDHEEAVFSGKSYELLKNGEFHHVPLLMGHTSLEAYLADIPGLLRLYMGTYDLFQFKLVPIDMHLDNIIVSYLIGGDIKKGYFGDKYIAQSDIEFMEFVSDDQFERPIRESVHLYSKKVPVFYYRFSYKGTLFGVVDRTVDGVGHAEDLGYLFDFGYNGTLDDNITRLKMVKLWTNFIKTGNPNSEADFILKNITWPPNINSTTTTLKCLDIDENLEVKEDLNLERMTFWKDLYDKYGSGMDTY